MLLFPRAHFSKAVTKAEQNVPPKAPLEEVPSFPTYKHYSNPSFRTDSPRSHFSFEDDMSLLPFTDHLIQQVFLTTAAERVIPHLYSHI